MSVASFTESNIRGADRDWVEWNRAGRDRRRWSIDLGEKVDG